MIIKHLARLSFFYLLATNLSFALTCEAVTTRINSDINTYGDTLQQQSLPWRNVGWLKGQLGIPEKSKDDNGLMKYYWRCPNGESSLTAYVNAQLQIINLEGKYSSDAGAGLFTAHFKVTEIPAPPLDENGPTPISTAEKISEQLAEQPLSRPIPPPPRSVRSMKRAEENFPYQIIPVKHKFSEVKKSKRAKKTMRSVPPLPAEFAMPQEAVFVPKATKVKSSHKKPAATVLPSEPFLPKEVIKTTTTVRTEEKIETPKSKAKEPKLISIKYKKVKTTEEAETPVTVTTLTKNLKPEKAVAPPDPFKSSKATANKPIHIKHGVPESVFKTSKATASKPIPIKKKIDPATLFETSKISADEPAVLAKAPEKVEKIPAVTEKKPEPAPEKSAALKEEDAIELNATYGKKLKACTPGTYKSLMLDPLQAMNVSAFVNENFITRTSTISGFKEGKCEIKMTYVIDGESTTSVCHYSQESLDYLADKDLLHPPLPLTQDEVKKEMQALSECKDI